MKKPALLLALGSIATIAMASEPVAVKERSVPSPDATTAWRQMAAVLATAPCEVAFLPTRTSSDGTTSIDYSTPNETLHFCQYVREEVSPTCVAKRSCERYATWTKANAVLDPRLPHSLFVSLLMERRPTPAGSSNQTSN